MTQPKTDAETIADVIGAEGTWPPDTHVYTWAVTDEQGTPSTMSFTYAPNGGVLRTPTGSLAIKDARSF